MTVVGGASLILAAVAGRAAGRPAAIECPGGSRVAEAQQLEICAEALFIALGKPVVYLRALGKAPPPSVAAYIG